MTIHQLIGRNSTQNFQLIRSDDVMGSPYGSGGIVLDVGVNLTLSLITTTSSLWTRSDILYGNSRGSCPRVRSNGSGHGSLNNLFRHPRSLLANAGRRLVLPSPQFGIHILVKFFRHFYKKHHIQDINTKKKKKKACMPTQKTYFFLLWL